MCWSPNRLTTECCGTAPFVLLHSVGTEGFSLPGKEVEHPTETRDIKDSQSFDHNEIFLAEHVERDVAVLRPEENACSCFWYASYVYHQPSYNHSTSSFSRLYTMLLEASLAAKAPCGRSRHSRRLDNTASKSFLAKVSWPPPPRHSNFLHEHVA